MVFSLLVNAKGAGGKERLKTTVTATSIPEFLDGVARAASVSRDGLDFEIFCEEFQEWASVDDIAEIPDKARVRLRRQEPAALPPPPEDAVVEAVAPVTEARNDEQDDDDEMQDAQAADADDDAPAAAEPETNVPEEWVQLCATTNRKLEEEGVEASLKLVFEKGEGSTTSGAHKDLVAYCSCGQKLMTGGGSTERSLSNAAKHCRRKHGPSSAEVHAKKVANSTSAAEPHGQKRSFAAAMSGDGGAQKTVEEEAKERYDAAAAILAGFKGDGLRLEATTKIVCFYCAGFSTDLLQKNLRANLQGHVNSESHKTASTSSSGQSRLTHFFKPM